VESVGNKYVVPLQRYHDDLARSVDDLLWIDEDVENMERELEYIKGRIAQGDMYEPLF